MKNLFRLFLLSFCFVAVACSSDEEPVLDEISEELNKTDQELYEEAKGYLQNGRYKKAVETFQEVERLYPFSPLASKARVMSAYSNYRDEEYDEAISIIDNFITLNPGSDDLEYVYYLKAISYYDRISDVTRDQEITEKAKSSFQELIRRFPSGSYAKDSRYKLDLIRDHLAGKEMEIGRFYLKGEKYIAASNRFKTVIEQFDDTNQIEEAYYRLVESYLLLGIDGEAVKYASILGNNYPESRWYNKAYNLIQKGEVPETASNIFSWIGLGEGYEDSTKPADLQSGDYKSKLDEILDGELD